MALDQNDWFYKELGAKIRKMRELRGISQLQMAEKLSLNRTSITNIENGKQRLLIHTLCQIAQILDVDFEGLLPSNGFEVSAEEAMNSFFPAKSGKSKHEILNRVMVFVNSQKELNA